MFRVVLHPSSGAHTTTSTASGICHTVTAICRYRGRAADSSNGVTNTRCCRYSCMRSWWWVKYHPKHVEQFPYINKLCNVASCWIYTYIGILLAHPILHISRIKVKVTCNKDVKMRGCVWLHTAESFHYSVSAAFITTNNTWAIFNTHVTWICNLWIVTFQSRDPRLPERKAFKLCYEVPGKNGRTHFSTDLF
jgi:hypothetical protein